MANPNTRGNPRFKGGGSQWKTSWGRKVPFTEMCCIEGMADDAESQFYEDPGGALDIVPASGWFLGTVFKLSAKPDSDEIIVRNGAMAGEGWQIEALAFGGATQVGFRMTVWDTGGARTLDSSLLTFPFSALLPEHGVDGLYVRLSAVFYPPGSSEGGAFGSFTFRVEGGNVSGATPLVAAYLNSSPHLFLGDDAAGGSAFEPPNCIHGLIGGDGPMGDNADEYVTAHQQWIESIGPAVTSTSPLEYSDGGSYQIEPFPDPSGLGRFANTNGWRANNPFLGPGIAPNPWEPFIGATDLVYGEPQPPARDLAVVCSQPTLFQQELFPI